MNTIHSFSCIQRPKMIHTGAKNGSSIIHTTDENRRWMKKNPGNGPLAATGPKGLPRPRGPTFACESALFARKEKKLLTLNRSSSTTSPDEAHSFASLTSLPISLLASSASCHHEQGPAGQSSSCGLRLEAEQSGCNSGMSSRRGCAQRRGTRDRPHVNRKKSHGGALDLKWGSAQRMWRPWWSSTRVTAMSSAYTAHREYVLRRNPGHCVSHMEGIRCLSATVWFHTWFRNKYLSYG
jgi:hypothetical protein